MPLGREEIEAKLQEAVREVWNGPEKDTLTVNLVRRRAEKRLGLEDGFLTQAEWNARSKQIVKEEVEELLRPLPPSSPPPTKPKISARPRGRPAIAANDAPKKKHQKIERAVVEPRSDRSELDEEKEEPEPAKKAATDRTGKKKAGHEQGGEVFVASEHESDAQPEGEEEQLAEAKKAKQFKELASIRESSDAGSSSLSSVPEDSSAQDHVELAPIDDDDLSEVNDDPLPPKRQRRYKDAKGKDGVVKPAPKRRKKTDAALSPNEEEIKKLQKQLLKCGVRKIWGFELKTYGDDDKAKIRHLRTMLKDMGMEGRFSEAKAEAIKERRELEADLEAVKKMNENWGASGGRTTRGRGGPVRNRKKGISDDEEDEQDGEGKARASDDSEAEAGPKMKRRATSRFRADLAFLEDESESE